MERVGKERERERERAHQRKRERRESGVAWGGEEGNRERKEKEKVVSIERECMGVCGGQFERF